MLVPQTVSKEVSDEITRIQRRGYFIDRGSEEYLRIDRKLRQLVKSDPPAAYWMLGALAAYAGDIDGMHANYKNAMRLSSNPLLRANYLITQVNLGYFSVVAKELSFLEKPENGQLENAVLLNTECARFAAALRVIKKWNELHQDCPWDEAGHDTLQQAAAVVQDAKIDDDAFLPSLDVIGETLRNHGLIFIREPVLKVLDEDGKKSISFRLLVNVPARTAAEIESEIVDRFFDLDVTLNESTIRFGLIAAQELVKQAA